MGLIEYHVQGLKELHGKLQELERQAEYRIVRDGASAAANVFMASIEAAAPDATGALKGAIRPTLVRTDNGVRVTIGTSKRDFPGRNKFYAAFVDLGHRSGGRRAFGIDTRRRTRTTFDLRHEVPADPFMQTGFGAAVPQAIAVFSSNVARGVEAVGGGA